MYPLGAKKRPWSEVPKVEGGKTPLLVGLKRGKKARCSEIKRKGGRGPTGEGKSFSERREEKIPFVPEREGFRVRKGGGKEKKKTRIPRSTST